MGEKQLTGIILSGGKSSRMGREKGLVEFRGKPLAAYAVEALQPVAGKILISANDQQEEYRKFGFEVIADEVKGIGPMGGLLTMLKHSKTEKNLVISCDTPFVNSRIFNYLYLNVRDYDVVVASHEAGKIEPLCGIYSRNIIPLLEERISAGQYKLRAIFYHLRFQAVVIDSSLPFYHAQLFFNVNKPEDLNV